MKRKIKGKLPEKGRVERSKKRVRNEFFLEVDEVEDWKRLCQIVCSVNAEAPVRFDEDGLKVSVMDIEKIRLLHLTVDEDNFLQYEVGDDVVFMWDKMLDMNKAFKKGRLYVSEENNEIRMEYMGDVKKLNYLKIPVVSDYEKQSMPKDLPVVKFDISVSTILDMVKDAGNLCTAIDFVERDDKLYVASLGDVGKCMGEFPINLYRDVDVKGIFARYRCSFITDFLDKLPSDKMVNIGFGDFSPLVMNYSGNLFKVSYVVAPWCVDDGESSKY